jgi:hypothetical protein
MAKIYINKWSKWEAFKNSLYVFDTEELRKNNVELKDLTDKELSDIIKEYDGDVYIESEDKTVIETMDVGPAAECDHFVQVTEEGTEVFSNEEEWGDGKVSPWNTKGSANLQEWLESLPAANTKF